MDRLILREKETVDVAAIYKLGEILSAAMAAQMAVRACALQLERQAGALFAEGVTLARPTYQQEGRYLYAVFPRQGARAAKRYYIGRSGARVEGSLALMRRGAQYATTQDELRRLAKICEDLATPAGAVLRGLASLRDACGAAAPITVL